MTANQVQIRRDTATNVNAVTPAAGELAWNTTNSRLHVGNGSTLGGVIMPNRTDVQNNTMTYAVTGGSGNAYTLTLAPALSAYTAGQVFLFKADRNNTGSATLNVNGLGAKTLKKITGGALADLAADDIINGGTYTGFYDGTYVQVINIASGGAVSISQGDINTSTGSVSTSGLTPANLTLPGGTYGFYPQVAGQGSFGVTATIANAQTSATYATIINLVSTNAGTTANAQQRYITSSPPFIMDGREDGDPAGGFIFALINSAGDIVAHYSADVPPWAYNGPTDIRAVRRDPLTGEKMRRVMKRRSLEEIMDGAAVEFKFEKITQAIKNADMDLIPHPFGAVPPGHTVVLLDPMDDRLPGLIEYQNAGGGEDIINAIRSGKIYADNEALQGRRGPAGVMQAGLRFKYSKK